MNLSELLQQELNPEQCGAVMLGPESIIRIVAGPGTGKTRTLVWRFLNLTIGQGLPPDRVLALTFTEKAATEMSDRVSLVFRQHGYRLHKPWISTFHAFCYRILNEAGERPYRVLNELEKLLVRRKVEREILARPDLTTSFPYLDFSESGRLLDDVFVALEKVRDAFWPEEEIILTDGNAITGLELCYRRDITNFTAEVYRLYREKLTQAEALDYPEMVYRAYHHLRDNESLRQTLQDQFSHILVDEFQDTSRSQLDLLKLLSPGLQRVTVVGDRKQSIYGWRNARPENFADPALLAGLDHFLTGNYRSFQAILDAGSHLLSPLADKGLFAPEELKLAAHRGNREGCVMLARPTNSVGKEAGPEAEARYIARQIKQLLNEEPDQTLAILLRSIRSHSKVYEDALRAEGLDYVTYGAAGFYDRKEVRDLLALLRLIESPADGQAFYRVAASPLFGYDQTALYRISREARNGKTYYDSWQFEDGLPTLGDMSTINKSIAGFLAECRAESARNSPLGLLEWLLSGPLYAGYLESCPAGERARVEGNLKKLLTLVSDLVESRPRATLAEVVEYFNLWLDNDLREPEESPALLEIKPGLVQLMTIHQAKGLEFDTVFVAGIKPSPFRMPNKGFVFDPDFATAENKGFVLLKYQDGDESEQASDYEKYRHYLEERGRAEERFVYYVALTRARSRLYITTPYSEKVIIDMKNRAATYFYRELDEWATSSAHARRLTFS